MKHCVGECVYVFIALSEFVDVYCCLQECVLMSVCANACRVAYADLYAWNDLYFLFKSFMFRNIILILHLQVAMDTACLLSRVLSAEEVVLEGVYAGLTVKRLMETCPEEVLKPTYGRNNRHHQGGDRRSKSYQSKSVVVLRAYGKVLNANSALGKALQTLDQEKFRHSCVRKTKKQKQLGEEYR